MLVYFKHAFERSRCGRNLMMFSCVTMRAVRGVRGYATAATCMLRRWSSDLRWMLGTLMPITPWKDIRGRALLVAQRRRASREGVQTLRFLYYLPIGNEFMSKKAHAWRVNGA